jgi:hypothetical protein
MSGPRAGASEPGRISDREEGCDYLTVRRASRSAGDRRKSILGEIPSDRQPPEFAVAEPKRGALDHRERREVEADSEGEPTNTEFGEAFYLPSRFRPVPPTPDRLPRRFFSQLHAAQIRTAPPAANEPTKPHTFALKCICG